MSLLAEPLFPSPPCLGSLLPRFFQPIPTKTAKKYNLKKNSCQKKLKTIKTSFCMMEYNIGKAFFIDVTMKALFLFHYTLKD